MSNTSSTRGYGILEGFLAKERAKTANKFIPPICRLGKILDLGCGKHPYFLINAGFFESHGLDKVGRDKNYGMDGGHSVYVKNWDFENNLSIPHSDNFFDAVTMLAVIEHVETDNLPRLLKEIYRILKPGGIYVITTPANWTDFLLKTMARIRLLSPDEISDHKDVYTHKKLGALLEKAGFLRENICLGHFEIFMNLWVTATK
ncbi:MAG: methyltransferase domain-containing protein [Deltaproteobacteria bacterium]|jgi:SAM-dependent methyltransferase|nr:methyltransferase domain-containing protein [Deltaproteobacteria bacterium]